MSRVDQANRLNRRDWLRDSGAMLASASVAGVWLAGRTQRLAAAEPAAARPKVAVVLTEFTYRSHAHVILENFLKPYLFNGQWTEPGMDVVAMYVDQFPEGRDMARAVSKEFNVPIFGTIGEAVCVGGKELAVDGVLSIGEHGDYPHNEKGQHEYPRKRFFDEIVAVYERSGRSVPTFSDKHLSYRWDWAKEMYDTSQRLKIPFMAGSSVPLAQRWPRFELEPGSKLKTAVSIHGGGVESYDFHGLEVLQSIVEARAGGESGVKSVQFLEGEKLWRAAADGRWSVPVAEAAMQAELGPGQPPLKKIVERLMGNPNAIHGLLVDYRDGFTGTVLAIGGRNRWNFAVLPEGADEPQATTFYVGPWENRNLFKALSHAIQTCIRERSAPYPVERTLLVTGVLDACMQSRYEGGTTQQTPQLAIAYQPRDYRAMREMGASWRIITEGTPEPPGIDPGGRA
jgi:hypothetical protein